MIRVLIQLAGAMLLLGAILGTVFGKDLRESAYPRKAMPQELRASGTGMVTPFTIHTGRDE